MQHNPQVTVIATLQFDEVVATSQCADLLSGRHYCHAVSVKSGWHVLFILRGFMMLSSQGNPFTYSSHNLFAKYILWYFFNKKICFHGTHTATDIYSYRVGDYYSFRCQYTAYRHSFTTMCIGHQGKVAEQERQCSQIVYLFPSVSVQLACPQFYGYFVHLNHFHVLQFLLVDVAKICTKVRNVFA